MKDEALKPRFTSVKEAARYLDCAEWSVYALLDKGVIASQYMGNRRKVLIASLEAYAESLPSEPSAS